MAATHYAATFNKPGFPVIDNHIFCLTGDGCLQEGVAAEACALAGYFLNLCDFIILNSCRLRSHHSHPTCSHLALGRLIVLYDDNLVQIDGSTNLAFTENVLQRFEAYGWHTLEVADGDHDLKALEAAVEIARGVSDKPSIIRIRTTIGFGSKMQGTEKVRRWRNARWFNLRFHIPLQLYMIQGSWKSFGSWGCCGYQKAIWLWFWKVFLCPRRSSTDLRNRPCKGIGSRTCVDPTASKLHRPVSSVGCATFRSIYSPSTTRRRLSWIDELPSNCLQIGRTIYRAILQSQHN